MLPHKNKTERNNLHLHHIGRNLQRQKKNHPLLELVEVLQSCYMRGLICRLLPETHTHIHTHTHTHTHCSILTMLVEAKSTNVSHTKIITHHVKGICHSEEQDNEECDGTFGKPGMLLDIA